MLSVRDNTYLVLDDPIRQQSAGIEPQIMDVANEGKICTSMVT